MAAGLAVLGVASATDAQQWTIYLHGHTEPVRATFYTEETPWIFYRDDDSQYVFAVGCDRVRRVTRDGIEIALFCPVERLPTMMPRVYQGDPGSGGQESRGREHKVSRSAARV